MGIWEGYNKVKVYRWNKNRTALRFLGERVCEDDDAASRIVGEIIRDAGCRNVGEIIVVRKGWVLIFRNGVDEVSGIIMYDRDGRYPMGFRLDYLLRIADAVRESKEA